MPRSKTFAFDDFYCTQCGTKGIPIIRKRGSERSGGHLKKIFCLQCGRETNHVECKPFSKYTYDDFLFEFNLKNFDKEGNRIRTYGQLKELVNNGKI